MSNISYSKLSRFYEYIIDDKEYNVWLDSIVSKLKTLTSSTKGVDLACGSGLFTRKLKLANFDVFGLDISQDMLEKAIEGNNKHKLNIQYLQGDLTKLKLFDKVGFITVINDGINYVKHQDLLKTFKGFYKALQSNGVLIFDISSEYKLKNVLGNNMFGDDGEKLSYVWFNELDEENSKVNMSLSFFEKEGETYKRYNEENFEYIHTEEDIVNKLKESGFKTISVYDKNFNKVDKNSDRLIFIAIK